MKLLTISLAFFTFFFSYSPVLAHGGFEKRAGNVIVYVKQTPISPLVGEKVKLSLSFRDEGIPETGNLSAQNLVDWPILLSVVDTFSGDESKDKIIYQKEYKTDANGALSFEYTFSKENYFDIDLDFKDSKGSNLETGFLIQPRTPKDIIINSSFDLKYILLSYLIGVLTILSIVKFPEIKKLIFILSRFFPK